MHLRRLAIWGCVVLAILMAIPQAFSSATLLPNGRQQFFNGAGVPLAGGFVYFYIPGTSSNKNTWLDAGATTLNTNPVILDGGGMATIYGIGQYRQVVQDSLGNLIWDQNTNENAAALDVQTGAIVYGGASTGAANTYAITLTPPVTAYTAGQRFQFIAHETNVGASTLNVGGTGAKNIFQLGSSGPTALIGGEIVIGNIVDVLFDGAQFQLLTQPIITPAAIPSGAIMAYGSTTNPAGWLNCDGSAVSRTTYATLFAVLGTSFGVGNGTTTFNLPDLRGRAIAGYDAGDATGRLTAVATGGVAASTLGNSGGEQAHTQTLAELVSHTHTIQNFAIETGGTSNLTGGVAGGVTTATSDPIGGGNAFNVVQPTLITNFIIKTALHAKPANDNKKHLVWAI